ncbi:hypothetical protein [Methylobacterium gnaphalii]|uniref:Bacteriophage tail tape measure N-terminal domain-containing protein n=1 Tax=Methylobacterium gnaphalii TaxID=1010610 RepID=A0A512JQW3_9HYPH|nr:hypothetical protein [Methylobacterium gnaphalii]GEP12253.1 hypothetical protein MGN01_40980 [Methylobacterium gnaphalii]GJD68743.1 hypothetical protein MMMDOFMJ_1667 [Methylobacterium gnaphalii]GLS49360.1 hypothetical protein GCM10007885_22080 [Methylobacterium gnaphalii]
MAEPLTLSFQADTSRAQSAMASLAASIIGNMASIGVAMSGGAANTNNFGGTLSGLQANAQRAAAAIGSDVKNIASATAQAASSDKATLESIVRAFTASTVASTTAQQTLRSSLTATTSTVSGIIGQLPSLKSLLAAFIAFEAVKLVFESVSASIEAARKHIEEFVQIGRDAQKVGVGSDFFQRATLSAEKYGLTVEQVTQALAAARAASDVRIGEGKDASNTSAFSSRLEQNVRAGNLSAADRRAFDGASDQEAKIRVVLGLIDKLRAESRDLAAFDLAGKFFGPDFERQLRNGVDLTTKLRETLDSSSTTVLGVRIVDPAEIERANQLDAKAKEIAETFASALAPITKDISTATLDTYEAFLKVEEVVARVLKIASDLYVQARDAVREIRNYIATIPYIGVLLEGSSLDIAKAIGRGVGVLDPEVQGPQAPLSVKVRPKGPDQSATLPSLHSKGGTSPTESLDAVETLINQLEKARDTAKAELDNVAKTNVERETAVALAKAEAAARQDFKTGKRDTEGLTQDEIDRTKAAAVAMQSYKDATLDAQQALRQAADTSRFFGQTATDALGQLLIDGRSASDVLDGLIKQLARAALQAAFLGTGPLAGLFGTAPAASAGSNAIGGLLGGVTKLFAANGADVAAGVPVTVGEMGREVFIPKADGKVYPIGAGSVGGGGIDNSRVIRIDARGAQAGVADQIVAAISAYDRQAQAALPGRIASVQKRG